MLEFIFTLVLMVSLGFMLYLMVIALPRVGEETAGSDTKNFLDRWAHSHVPEKVDAALNSFFLKLLRKTKVLVLKLDNTLGKRLKNMRLGDNAKKPIDFKDLAGQKSEEENIKN